MITFNHSNLAPIPKNEFYHIVEEDGTETHFFIKDFNIILHNLYGPAIEKLDGEKQWFVFGFKCSEKQFNSINLQEDYPNRSLYGPDL